MPDAVAPECNQVSRHVGTFNMMYAAVILLSLHWAVVLYVNSTYLELFMSEEMVGLLYTLSALLTIFIFMVITRVLGKTGRHALTLVLSVLEIFALVGLGFADTAVVVASLFMLHQTIVPLILFNLDIYIEELIGDSEMLTGARRGLLLTIMSLGGAVAPLAAGYLIGSDTPEFHNAYFAGALLMLPFLIIMLTQFSPKKHTESPAVYSAHVIRRFWKHKDLRNVFAAHFLLQIFFTWMVIYTPLFLAREIGLDWTAIGQILFVGLFAYVIFEYPIGVIADKWLGEKEIMALGFLIMAVSLSWFIFIEGASVLTWMIALFMTRVGASFAEVSTESYFFKQTQGSDASGISFFRMTRPLSYVIGAALGSISLAFFEFSFLFIILAFLMIPGFFFAMALHDTK